jgi:ankyrin repeat protein
MTDSSSDEASLQWVSQLYNAISTKNQEVLENVLNSQPTNEPLWSKNGGDTPLHWGVITGDVSIVEAILRKHICSINDANHGGETPLHYATKQGKNSPLINYLLSQGADIYLKTEKGRTVLHLACLCGAKHLVELFLGFVSKHDNPSK